MSTYFGRSVIPAFLLFILVQSAQSQDMEVGIFGGGSYYIGDLNPVKPFQNTQLSYGLLARYSLDTRWAFRVAVVHGKITGDASNGTPNIRNEAISFYNTLTDISGVVEFNFIPYFVGSQHHRISPYIYAGISGFYYSGVATYSKSVSEMNGTNFSIPFGLGAKYSISNRVGLQVYWEMHKTFFDKLDDVYGDLLPGGTIIVGDPNTNDWFSFAGVSLSYKFYLPGSNKCKDLNH